MKMKRLISTALLAGVLLAGSARPAAFAMGDPPVSKSNEAAFEYSARGIISKYVGSGEDYVYVPAEIGGVSIKSIGREAFANSDVNVVEVADGIERIEENAFAGSQIWSLDLPESMRYIGKNAFAYCYSLSQVWISSTQCNIAEGAFLGVEYLNVTMPCTLDASAADAMLMRATGNGVYQLGFYHARIREIDEKDAWGQNMLYCPDCGVKGSQSQPDDSLPFTDVSKDAWYYYYVYTAYDFGILNGKSATTFDPDAGMTLAEAAKIAACIYEYSMHTGRDFTARPGEKWYQPYVDYCYENGIMADNITFPWEQRATRAQMAYLFSRADMTADPPYCPNAEMPSTDIPDVNRSTPFADEIFELYRRGIAVGDERMAFHPNSDVKRSEAAAFITRLLCFDLRIELPKG